MATTAAKKKSSSGNRAPRRKISAKSAQWTLQRKRGLHILSAPPFSQLKWLVHGFSTRTGGTSELDASRMRSASGNGKAKERALNLGFTDWDSRKRVLENRTKFFHAIGADKMRAITLRQIHSDIAHRINSSHTSAKDAPAGDALFTRERGFLLAIQTADCIPILLADTKRRAVAAVHSGWRGTLARVAAKTLGQMQMAFGTQPEDVIAALGPGIGRCCYEVGSDVAKDFHAQFPNARDWFDGPFDALASGENDPNWLPWLTMKPPGHQPPPLSVNLDLIAANRAILVNAGVPSAKISSSDFCTACRTDLLFSYRREQKTGRMMAAIGIR